MKKEEKYESDLLKFRQHLREDEKAAATIEKYIRDVRRLLQFAKKGSKGQFEIHITKETVISFKGYLIESGYDAASINAMLSGVRSYLSFKGIKDIAVKNLRVQRDAYASREKELTKKEYKRLIAAAREKEKGKSTVSISLVMETICSAGIRVSELKYFTVENVRKGDITIRNKGKTRRVLAADKLRDKLLRYAKKNNIQSGAIFQSRRGEPISRSSIWRMLKSLCSKAEVAAEKVFPHNLRRLFARTFYEAGKDISALADVLGHTSINTTRIYIKTLASEHMKKLEKLGLIT